MTVRGLQQHVTAVFGKLGLAAGSDDNRRVLAVLEFIRLERPQADAG